MTTKKRKFTFRKTIKSGSRTKEPCRGFKDVDIEFVSQSGKVYNKMRKTCIYTGVDNDIYYLTTRHFLRENIDSIDIQKYYVMSKANNVISCKIMIKNKYIGCFIQIKLDWYAIMRQSMWMAYWLDTSKLEIYYKFKPGSIRIDKNGLIYFPHQAIYPAAETIKIKDENVEQIKIDENAINHGFFKSTYDNHSTSKKKTTDEIFQILDRFRLDIRHNYI